MIPPDPPRLQARRWRRSDRGAPRRHHPAPGGSVARIRPCRGRQRRGGSPSPTPPTTLSHRWTSSSCWSRRTPNPSGSRIPTPNFWRCTGRPGRLPRPDVAGGAPPQNKGRGLSPAPAASVAPARVRSAVAADDASGVRPDSRRALARVRSTADRRRTSPVALRPRGGGPRRKQRGIGRARENDPIPAGDVARIGPRGDAARMGGPALRLAKSSFDRHRPVGGAAVAGIGPMRHRPRTAPTPLGRRRGGHGANHPSLCGRVARVGGRSFERGVASPGTAATLRCLLERSPGSVRDRLNDGSRPLHLAAGRGVPLAIVELLVEHHPDAVRERTRKRCLPVHCVVAGCEHSPEGDGMARLAAARFLVEQWHESVHEVTGDGRLPLRLAAASDEGTLDLVGFLVEQHPEAVRRATPDGRRLPLHCAASRRSVAVREWRETVAFLIEQHPDSVRASTSDGLLPLHCAVERTVLRFWSRDERAAWVDAIRSLVQHWLPSAAAMTHAGWLPLHSAVAARAPVELVRYFVDIAPASVNATDATGSLPLHLAARSEGLSRDVIALLVAQGPESVRARDNTGSLPLHGCTWPSPRATRSRDCCVTAEKCWSARGPSPSNRGTVQVCSRSTWRPHATPRWTWCWRCCGGGRRRSGAGQGHRRPPLAPRSGLSRTRPRRFEKSRSEQERLTSQGVRSTAGVPSRNETLQEG
jgi:hypothetical protein